VNRYSDVADATADRRTQLEIVRDELVDFGRCDAHQMLMAHGITRCAAIIFKLRGAGMPIRTENEPGKMAVYVLEAPHRYEQPALGLVP